jgi:hypothetical protein
MAGSIATRGPREAAGRGRADSHQLRHVRAASLSPAAVLRASKVRTRRRVLPRGRAWGTWQPPTPPAAGPHPTVASLAASLARAAGPRRGVRVAAPRGCCRPTPGSVHTRSGRSRSQTSRVLCSTVLLSTFDGEGAPAVVSRGQRHLSVRIDGAHRTSSMVRLRGGQGMTACASISMSNSGSARAEITSHVEAGGRSEPNRERSATPTGVRSLAAEATT